VALVVKRLVSRVRREDPIADGVAVIKREASDKEMKINSSCIALYSPLAL
jgi:hypothetical protein